MKPLLALFLLFLHLSLLSSESQTITYNIHSKSQLYLEGSTNVNKFQCAYEPAFSKGVVELESTAEGRLIHFRNAGLALQTEGFDCQNKLMNREFYKALKSTQHPHVRIQLNSVRQESHQTLQNCEDWVTLQAQMTLTIAGVSQKLVIPIRAKKITPKQYHFLACQDILMSAFEITPPASPFGVVRVRDKITIHLDLLVDITC